MVSEKCPCGSNKKKEYCCGKYLEGKELPASAEQLMRSRYTAFYSGNINYIIATLHPDKRQPTDRTELAKTIASTQWLNLTIVATNQGKIRDRSGTVEFVAAFRDTTGKARQLHEKSRFTKQEGKWFYLDGDILPDYIPPNNAKCWCGSNKKYQKCHKG